jgi:hypothetical protein
MATTQDPGQLSAAALTMATRTGLMRDVYGGTETMRARQQEFLPQYEKESNTRYLSRLNSTFALNKLREAVDAASAKPFRTMLTLQNSDPDLDLWVKDIDLQGNHLHVFGHNFFNNAFLDSMGHILVDHPDTMDMPSLGAQKASGVRPFMKMIRNQDVVAAYDEYVGGDVQTVHVRVKGKRIERTPDYKEKIWNQIYVIEKEIGSDNGVVQLWEQEAGTGGGQWTSMGEKAITIPEVPFVTLYAGDKEADYIARPVFIDLAYKQIEHWISSSDQRSILAAARFPMLAASGVQIDPDDEAEFAIGPYKVLYAPDANGRWYFVEPKGTAIASGQKDLEMLEMQMDMMSLNPVTGTHRQYVPQNERDIQETRVHSVVHDLAIGCQNGIEKAVRFMGNWTNKDYTQVKAVLNTEFSNTKDKLAEVAQIVALWEKKGISRDTLYRELQKRNLLGEEFSIKDEIALFAKVDQLLQEDPAASGKTEPKDEPVVTDPEEESWPKGQNRPKLQV